MTGVQTCALPISLTIDREGFFTRLADAIGLDDIEFELQEFNDAFNVKAKDRKFANDLIDQRMMRFLLTTDAAFRISGWNALDNKRLDDAKGQLAHGHPVVFGMEVSEQFENLQGSTIYDDVSSPRTGGHAMVLVGYSERRQAFKVMNSWGTEWGEGGFGWISYRAVRQLSDLMFTMEIGRAHV